MLKTLEDLRQFYETDLLPDLEVLEAERKKVADKLFFAGIIILAPVIPLSIYFRHYIPLVLGIVLWGLIYFFSIQGYVKNFKNNIIEKIIHAIDSSLVYSRESKIPESLFIMSGIFRNKPDVYDGDDHVSGKIGETKIEFSELHAQYVTYDSKGRRQYHNIFKGLFIISDFNKAFKHRTVVLPDTAEKILGHVGTFFQSMNKGRGDLIKLEDPEFEKLFAVYGDDQIESRYILSTSLMRRIVEYNKKTRNTIYMSFTGAKMFMAIPYTRDLFEPRVFRTVLDFTPIKRYFEDLKVAVDIVEDLNLNTRIWG